MANTSSYESSNKTSAPNIINLEEMDILPNNITNLTDNLTIEESF